MNWISVIDQEPPYLTWLLVAGKVSKQSYSIEHGFEWEWPNIYIAMRTRDEDPRFEWEVIRVGENLFYFQIQPVAWMIAPTWDISEEEKL